MWYKELPNMGIVTETDAPHDPWAAKVVKWAEEHAIERGDTLVESHGDKETIV